MKSYISQRTLQVPQGDIHKDSTSMTTENLKKIQDLCHIVIRW